MRRKKEQPEALDPMNELAMNIWAGQSVSLPLTLRTQRIRDALIGHGYSADEVKTGLKLPVQGFERYL